MKKSIAIAAVLSVLLLASCSDEQPTAPVNATVDTTSADASDTSESDAPAEPAADASAADITAAVTAEIEIPSAVEKNADNIGAFYDVDVSAVTDMSVLICGSGAYPDELAVFKFTDAEAAKTGAEAVQKRLDSQIELYSDYTPDEMYKLEDAFVITKDNWVAMAACSDNSRAKEIIEGML
ncbi:MAG: DUF4358 domain-containing protein [Ruminococcus sp.]|nr:DUF4358 domain-containing protein [Ruminococcus sp.]